MAQAAEIRSADPVLGDERPLLGAERLGLGGLGRAEDDVGRPERLDAAEGGLLVSFADRHHHDHRGHPENDAQAGEDRPQHVKPQVAEPETDDFEEEAHWGSDGATGHRRVHSATKGSWGATVSLGGDRMPIGAVAMGRT